MNSRPTQAQLEQSLAEMLAPDGDAKVRLTAGQARALRMRSNAQTEPAAPKVQVIPGKVTPHRTLRSLGKMPVAGMKYAKTTKAARGERKSFYRSSPPSAKPADTPATSGR